MSRKFVSDEQPYEEKSLVRGNSEYKYGMFVWKRFLALLQRGCITFHVCFVTVLRGLFKLDAFLMSVTFPHLRKTSVYTLLSNHCIRVITFNCYWLLCVYLIEAMYIQIILSASCILYHRPIASSSRGQLCDLISIKHIVIITSCVQCVCPVASSSSLRCIPCVDTVTVGVCEWQPLTSVLCMHLQSVKYNRF